MPRLVCLSGMLEGKEFPVRDRMRIGRLESCEVFVPDDDVSREHATIRRQGEGWVIQDLGSRNGTAVNGKRVKAAATLRPGDEVEIGDLVLVFEEEAAAGSATPAPVPPPEADEAEADAEPREAEEAPRPRPLRAPTPMPARGFAFEAQLRPRQREALEMVLFGVVWVLAFLCASAGTQVLLRVIAV
jgi:predicted component of type VI protein secretion system